MDSDVDDHYNPVNPNVFAGSVWEAVPPPPVELAGNGNCANHPEPRVFFDAFRTGEAAEACVGCPVYGACLEYGLANAVHLDGVWGGMTMDERRYVTGHQTERPPKLRYSLEWRQARLAERRRTADAQAATVDDRIADLLDLGHTVHHICTTLKVGHKRVRRVLTALDQSCTVKAS